MNDHLLTQQLIEFIKGFPILYDHNHPDHGNTLKKNDAYSYIAAKLNVTDRAVYSKWKHLKYSYTRYCNPKAQTSLETEVKGKGRRRRRDYTNWKWGPYLTFLNKSSTDKSEGLDSNKLLLTEEVDIKFEEDEEDAEDEEYAIGDEVEEDEGGGQTSGTLSCYSGGSNSRGYFEPAEDSTAAYETTLIFPPPSPSNFTYKVETCSEDSPAPMLKQMLDAPSIFRPPPMIARDIQVLGFKDDPKPPKPLKSEPIPEPNLVRVPSPIAVPVSNPIAVRVPIPSKPIPKLVPGPSRRPTPKPVFERPPDPIPVSDSDSDSEPSTPPPPEERTKYNLNKALDFLQKKREKDPIDLLFESYGKTLKRLKPRTRASIKIKLARLFAEFELKS